MAHWKYKFRELLSIEKRSKEFLLGMKPSVMSSYISGGEFADEKLLNVLFGVDELFTTTGDFYNFDDTLEEVLDMSNARDGYSMLEYVSHIELLAIQWKDYHLMINARQLNYVLKYYIDKYESRPNKDLEFVIWREPIGYNDVSIYDAVNAVEIDH